jgi:hypothetical protein
MPAIAAAPAARSPRAHGREVTAVQYLAAVRDARRYAEDMAYIFEQYADAIITLSARGVAPEGLDATGDPVFCTLWPLTAACSRSTCRSSPARTTCRSACSSSARAGATSG